jgi:hypothetical protein
LQTFPHWLWPIQLKNIKVILSSEVQEKNCEGFPPFEIAYRENMPSFPNVAFPLCSAGVF